MNSVALLVLLDAFRPDYLWRTHFLRDLSRRSGVGQMEEPFGFLPRAAYFGGLTPNETGYSNIFVREPWRSPFPAIPGFAQVLGAIPGIEGVQRSEMESSLRTTLEAEARSRLPDFGARYAAGFALPVQDLSYYAIAETTPPWGPRCGYRSLFHILDDAGIPWVQCSWPYTRTVAGADPAIVAKFLDDLTPQTRFGFVHLSQLDAIGHTHGPGSKEMQSALEEIDGYCESIHTAALERFDRVRILFFGDHGMITVVRTFDLATALRNAGWEAGREFEMFLDSPMARFWFHSRLSREGVVKILNQLDCGRVLSSQDLERYGAGRMQPGNAELFFIAHPGVMFSPNAFQGDSIPVRGMHGYLPDVPDNRGLTLAYDSMDRTAGSLGIAEARQLFPTCLEMCGIDPAAHTPILPLRVTPKPASWTRLGVPAHEARVNSDLSHATSLLTATSPASAVVVMGSFGRGEGGVVDSASGVTVLNDYDFAVIGADAEASSGLGQTLAVQLGIDFCDVLTFTAAAGMGPSQLKFDLRYSGRVVAGDPRVLNRIPAWAPDEIPDSDAALLLMNRLVGVMLVPLPQQDGRSGPLDQFATNQIAKALIAVGDAHLLEWGEYSSHCAERSQRFAALAPALDISPDIAGRINTAYSYKLDPIPAPGPFGPADFFAVRDAIATTLRVLTSRQSPHEPTGRGLAISAALGLIDDAAADDHRAAAKLRLLGFSPSETNPAAVPIFRRAILEGLLHLFFATDGSEISSQAWDVVRERLATISVPPAGLDHPDSAFKYEVARKHLAAAWLSVFHSTLQT